MCCVDICVIVLYSTVYLEQSCRERCNMYFKLSNFFSMSYSFQDNKQERENMLE